MLSHLSFFLGVGIILPLIVYLAMRKGIRRPGRQRPRGPELPPLGRPLRPLLPPPGLHLRRDAPPVRDRSGLAHPRHPGGGEGVRRGLLSLSLHVEAGPVGSVLDILSVVRHRASVTDEHPQLPARLRRIQGQGPEGRAGQGSGQGGEFLFFPSLAPARRFLGGPGQDPGRRRPDPSDAARPRRAALALTARLKYLLDTHAFLWAAIDEDRLGEGRPGDRDDALRAACDFRCLAAGDRAPVASGQGRRPRIPSGRPRRPARLRERPADHARDRRFSPGVALAPQRPVDRIIAATAKCHRLSLITKDANIAESSVVPVVW